MAHIQNLVPRLAPDCISAAPASVQLERKLGLLDATAVVVSNIIGVGIFTTPAVVASLVPAAVPILSLWVVGGLLALAGAITYAQLSRLCPRAGGEYNYLSQAFGPLAGFLSGWISLIAGFSGAIAACAVALVSYLGRYLPGQTSDTVVASLSLLSLHVAISRRSLLAATFILVFALIHICGLGPGKVAQKSLAVLVLAAMVIFVVAGFWIGRGSLPRVEPSSAPFHPLNWLLALVPVMFTYSGWNAAAYLSEETREPERNVGVALTLGTLTVLALYFCVNALFLKALAPREMAAAIDVGDSAAQRLFGVASGFLTPVLITALLGAISAMTIAGPRVYFAMSRDRAFLPVFGRLSPKLRTPALAIALQAAWSIILVLLGSFEQIFVYTGFAILVSSAATVPALYVLQRRSGVRQRSITDRAVPAVFFTASVLISLNALYRAPKPTLVGLLMITAGIPVFVLSRKTGTLGKS